MDATLQFDSKTNQPILSSTNTFPLKDPSIGDDIRLPKDNIPKGIQIQPKEGFSYKTRRTDDDSKVFINIVIHEKLQKPSTKKKLDAEGNEVEGLNIPMSVGAAHIEADKKGVQCTAYDIVVHPDVLLDMESDETGKFREFLCQLGIQCLEQKYKEKLDKRYKLPKLAYFGAAVPPQTIQDRVNVPKIEEVKTSSKSSSKTKEQAPAVVKRILKDLPLNSYWCNRNSNSTTNLVEDGVFNSDLVGMFGEQTASLTANSFSLSVCDSVKFGEYMEPTGAVPSSLTQAIVVEANFQVYDFNLLTGQSQSSSGSKEDDLQPLNVEISPYTMKVCVPGYKSITLYFGAGVVPPKSYYHLVKIVGSVSLYRLIIVLSLDVRPLKDVVDPGSKPWLVLQALRDEDNKSNAFLDEMEEWEASAKDSSSTLSGPKYPGSRVVDVGQVEEDTELPEDTFHRKDAASSWIISQREQSRMDKAKKYDDERKVLANDPNVEFVDMQKPTNNGGRYPASENKMVENDIYRAASAVSSSVLLSEATVSTSSAAAAVDIHDAKTTTNGLVQKTLRSLQSNMWTELLD